MITTNTSNIKSTSATNTSIQANHQSIAHISTSSIQMPSLTPTTASIAANNQIQQQQQQQQLLLQQTSNSKLTQPNSNSTQSAKKQSSSNLFYIRLIQERKKKKIHTPLIYFKNFENFILNKQILKLYWMITLT